MAQRTLCCAAALLLTVVLKVAGADLSPAAGEVSVRVAEPAMNEVFAEGATMTLIAEASAPPGRIAKVEFYNNDQLIGVSATAPYQLSYSRGGLLPGNYSIHAKAYDDRGRSAVSPAVTVTARRRAQWTARSYDYEETNEGALKQARLTIPDGLGVVRGVLVFSNAAGGDTREAWKQSWCREFLYMHDFAFLGTKAFNSHSETLIVFHNALRQFAGDSGHREIESAPFAIFGFSAGAGFAMTLLDDRPDRVIACAAVSARNVRMDSNDAVAATPLCLISGEMETTLNAWIVPLMEASRPKGALFSWMSVQGFAHRFAGQQVLAIPLLDQAIRLRYPVGQDPLKGPVQLLPVDPRNGWIADHTTWKSGLTTITPYADFKGPLGTSSWLLNKDIAFIYRAFATYDNPLKITSLPPTTGEPPVLDPGARLTLLVDDSAFPHWRSMEFFAGAQKLGEAHAPPARFTVSDLKTGVYAFTVLATDAKGIARTSNPALVLVRKLPKEAP